LPLIPASYHGRGGAAATAKTKTTLDPEPLQKWAEESFAVVEVGVSDANVAKEACLAGIKALKELPECISTDKIGVIGMCILTFLYVEFPYRWIFQVLTDAVSLPSSQRTSLTLIVQAFINRYTNIPKLTSWILISTAQSP
jgi:hypothetical protein